MKRAMLVTRRTVILKCHFVPHQNRCFCSELSDGHKVWPRREELNTQGVEKTPVGATPQVWFLFQPILPLWLWMYHLTTRAPGSSLFKEKMSLQAGKSSWRHQRRQPRTMGASAPAPCPFHLAGCLDRDSRIFPFLWSMALPSLKDSFSLLIRRSFWVACTFDLGHYCNAWTHKMSKWE